MRTVEESAKTREQAIQKAMEKLGVEMYEVDNIEILDEGSSGFLGFGARPARVRLTVNHLPDESEVQPTARVERPRESREGDDRGTHGGRGSRGNQRGGERRQENRDEKSGERRGAQREQERGRDNRPGRGTDRKGEPRQERGQERGQQRPQANRAEGGQERKPENRPERGGQREQERGRDNRQQGRPQERRGQAQDRTGQAQNRGGQPTAPRREAAPAPVKNEPAPADEDDLMPVEAEESELETQTRTSGADEEAITAITDEQGQEAAVLLQETIDKMGIAAQVRFERPEAGGARLAVESEDGAILIGRKGRTLSALQYLINRMISQTDKAETTERLAVDVEGYVDRRRESLEAMALSLAQRAKETCRNMRLKPLSPQERRIIHVTLQNDPEVRTYSLGNSLFRSVVISPGNARPEGQERPRGRRPGGGGGQRRGRQGGRQGGRRQQDDSFDAGHLSD